MLSRAWSLNRLKFGNLLILHGMSWWGVMCLEKSSNAESNSYHLVKISAEAGIVGHLHPLAG